ncbi:MAG: N-terminal phage integrase SAM-like domain-containing protein [Actinomycetota bacterium]
MSGKRRRWGRVRRLPSGMYQGRYPDPRFPGTDRTLTLDSTYGRKSDCERALDEMEVRLRSGEWIDPRLSATNFEDYALRWLEDHPRLRPNTRRTYASEIRHLINAFGPMRLGDITPIQVRAWHSHHLRNSGLSAATVAKHYKRLRQVMQTAFEDELISRNPVKIRGAANEPISELRPPTPSEWRRLRQQFRHV